MNCLEKYKIDEEMMFNFPNENKEFLEDYYQTFLKKEEFIDDAGYLRGGLQSSVYFDIYLIEKNIKIHLYFQIQAIFNNPAIYGYYYDDVDLANLYDPYFDKDKAFLMDCLTRIIKLIIFLNIDLYDNYYADNLLLCDSVCINPSFDYNILDPISKLEMKVKKLKLLKKITLGKIHNLDLNKLVEMCKHLYLINGDINYDFSKIKFDNNEKRAFLKSLDFFKSIVENYDMLIDNHDLIKNIDQEILAKNKQKTENANKAKIEQSSEKVEKAIQELKKKALRNKWLKF